MSSNIVDEIVIRVRADLEKFKGEIIAANGSLKKFEDGMKTASTSTQKLDAGIKAFTWTTFSQGALNTSTALAQLYTSISNIAKIQYTLKAAMIGVERAEDLVARKTLQLTKEVEKNGTMSRTAILLRNELATATNDLAVKNERVAIAQDAVNDTYILFTSNVVNTVFGTFQTLVGLKTMLATRALAAKASIDQETASFATNTIAAKANAAAVTQMATARVGLTTGISPLSNMMGTVSQTTSKFSGILSKLGGVMGVTVVGAAASAAIGIGALVYDQMKANDVTQKQIEKLNGLSKEFALAESAAQDFSNTINSGKFLSPFDMRIEDLRGKISDLKQELSVLTDPETVAKPNLFVDPAEKLKAISDAMKATTEAEKQLAQTEVDKAKAAIARSQTFQGLVSGNIELVDREQLDIIEKIISETDSLARKYDEMITPAIDDYAEMLAVAVKETGDENDLLEYQRNIIFNMIMAQRQLNDVKSQGNEISRIGNERELKYLREIADLKKKQDPIYQKRSLFSGILGLEEDFLEGKFGKEIASHLGYQPFMGVISKRNNEVKMITDLIRLDNQLYGYTNMLEELMVILPGVSDPAQRKQITDTIIALRDNISKVKSEAGPSISSSNKTIAGFARQYTQAIGQLQNNLRSLVSHGFGSFPTFGGQDRLSQYYTNQMRSITGGAGALARSMVERTVVNRNTILASIRGVNTSRIGSVQRTTVSVPGYGNLSVRKRGGKGKYRTRQESINMANQNYSYQLQQLTGYSLSELQSLTGLEIQHVDPNAVLWATLGSGRSNRNQRVTPEMAQQRADYVRNYMERLERNRAEVSSRISLITELTSINPYLSLSLGQQSTQLSSILKEQENLLQLVGLSKTQAKEIVVTPTRGRTEIDDRIRWTQRLEQISTGATVF